ncbi:MAG TPA: CoA transferase [Candidatus Binataceae bacterium]|nr:CoA transferase [Candidatus Binataceae bacterium]
MGSLPFEGIRIADFGWIFAIPHATSWLGSLGADVIRVESTTSPDLVRFLSGTDGAVGINRSGMYNSINSCKRSLALNLSHARGREIALKLVSISDIATENFTVGNMAKFGLTYEDLRRVKPDIIMMSGTPLGQTGPYAKTVGFGPTTQAFAGMCHLTGYPGGFPCGIGGTWPDFAVGVTMVFFLLAALHHRDRTCEGQYLDLSMAETVTSMLPEGMMEYFLNWTDARPIGNRDESMAPHGVFPVKGDDRWVAIAVTGDAEFEALCDALGLAGMARDPRFATLASRLHNVDALEAEIAARTREFEREELVQKLRERGVAAGPVYSPPDVMQDEAFQNSGMLVELEHGESGKRVVPGIPVGFSAMKSEYYGAPMIGQHTDEVLSEVLGYHRSQIEEFRLAGAII